MTHETLDETERYVIAAALTPQGIQLLKGSITDKGRFVTFNAYTGYRSHSRTMHYATHEEAKAAAQAMRDRKITALLRKIKQLKMLTFDVQE